VCVREHVDGAVTGYRCESMSEVATSGGRQVRFGLAVLVVGPNQELLLKKRHLGLLAFDGRATTFVQEPPLASEW